MDTVSPRARWVERLAALALGLGVLAATQIPALWGWRAQRLGHYPGHVFTGALHTYADDAATYWSWMDQAREGRLAFTDRFTHEAHPRNYVNVLFFTLGSVARLTGAGVVKVYTAARPVLGAVLLLLLYLLAARLFTRPEERFVCFLFLALSSGWEGIGELAGPALGIGHVSSPQWWTPEMSTFFSMVLFPHFLAGFIAMAGSLLLMMSAWSEDARPMRARVRLALGVGAVLFVLTFFHPYDVVALVGTVAGAPFLFALLGQGTLRRDLTLSAVAMAVWLPALLYNYWLFTQNPAMRAWDLQNIMVTPTALGLLIGFGVGLPLALLSLLALRRMGRPLLVMWAWLGVILFCIHLPVRFQRRMIGGVQFPLAGLAAAGLFLVVLPWLTRRFAQPRARAPLALALGLLMVPLQVTTPYFVCRAEWHRLRRVEYPAWLPAPLRAALGFLAGTPGPEALVLASYDTGNYVPHYSGKRCVLGHYALTIDADRRQEEIARFFSEEKADDAWRTAMLRTWGVRYLVAGPYERALGSFDPARHPWLHRLHVEGAGTPDETAVYAVELPP
ncbi:MAG TPA: hypothetical protein VFV75_06510 [Candidatus Polarisedimenticolaceae bacterium]|nr:hypothetical protein [Candidatus Polarisedimenticolaceae bacterium]